MAEFTQGSAVLVERDNVEQLASQLDDLLSNQQLRRSVAEAGLLRSREFSWKRCAQETLEIYRTVS